MGKTPSLTSRQVAEETEGIVELLFSLRQKTWRTKQAQSKEMEQSEAPWFYPIVFVWKVFIWSYLVVLPFRSIHQAVCSAQSELFFRLLLKNTVRRVQIAAYPNFLAASKEAHK